MPAVKTAPVMPHVDEMRKSLSAQPYIVEADKCGELPLLQHRNLVDYKERDERGRVSSELYPWLQFDRTTGQMVIPRNGVYHCEPNGLKVNCEELIALIEQQFLDHEAFEASGGVDGWEWPEVRKYNLRRARTGEVPQPFGNFDKLTADQIADVVALQLEGVDDKDRRLVEHCVRYELQRPGRKHPDTGDALVVREEVLHKLEALLTAVDDSTDAPAEGL